MTSELIEKKKVSIPDSFARVTRERLFNRMNQSLDNCNLTVVHGRAGTGKTMLTADFARQCGRKVAWVSLDASDGDPSRFFRYLIAAVQPHHPHFGWAFIPDQTLNDVARLAESLAWELEHPETPTLIVLDNLHQVYDTDWAAPFLSRFSSLMPPHAHLVLVGRITPPAPLWRMRSKQTLTIIDEFELAFTSAEIATLTDSLGLPRSAATWISRESRGRASTVACLAELTLDRASALQRTGSGPRNAYPAGVASEIEHSF
jgi:LuxR family maltose regulon positive regulatory protein